MTHDVRRFTVRKPQGYRFEPGQATLVSVNRPGWEKKKRPFTFTSLNDWPDLEFTTKIYPDHHGVTEQLGTLEAGDSLLIEDPWGTIQYKGPGTFIAGGAGVTPFIAILRQLAKDGRLAGNTLLFSNKTARDIILRHEFEAMQGLRCVFTLTDEPDPDAREPAHRPSVPERPRGRFRPALLCLRPQADGRGPQGPSAGARRQGRCRRVRAMRSLAAWQAQLTSAGEG